MPRTMAEQTTKRQQRVRVACRRCNAKKVRCDSSRGIPCRGCVAAGAECVLIDSQRGRYTRHRTRKATPARPPSSADSPDRSPSAASSNEANSPKEVAEAPPAAALDPDAVALPTERLSRPFGNAAPDSNGMLYLHIADQGVSAVPQPIADTTSTLFLGESFSLTYVVQNVLAPFLGEGPSFQRRLHFPIVEGYDPAGRDGASSIQAQVRLLRERDILYELGPQTLERLLTTYFRWFHPAFPVVQETGFLARCLRGEMSLLVLNAVLMVAVTLCEDRELRQTGLATRYKAREVFYRQARALYDSDLDSDKTNNVVALFLMSFWWGGPNDEKDSWHWIGIAISLAQSLGMHRSTSQSHMSSHTTKHWRRIWWSLRVRDSLMSGSIGRPQHFSVHDCDVEMVEPADTPDILHGESEETYYASQMARLSIIFSNIVASRYSALHSATPDEKTRLENAIDAFRSQIPPPLQYKDIDPDTGRGLWAAMLLMAYNFGVILLCRPTRSIGTCEREPWGNHSKAFAAANEVTRVMEDILSVSMGRLCQIHTIPALFNSLAMHVFSICTSGTIGRELAENRARTCMLGLTSLQDCWPVSGWILRLFVAIMEMLKKKLVRSGGPRLSSFGESSTARSGMTPRTTTTAASPFDGEGVVDGALACLEAGDGGFFPDLFVLDEVLHDPRSEQVNFFDLLRVPDWDSVHVSA